MKKLFWTAAILAMSMLTAAQAGIVRGTVIDEATGKPAEGVAVSMAGGSIVTVTASDGTFVLNGVEEGNGIIAFSGENYASCALDVTVMSDPLTVNVEVEPTTDKSSEVKEGVASNREENVLLFDESMLDEEGATSNQSVAYLAGSSDDVFVSASSYVFSPMRFSLRGYDQRDHITYINGIDFTDTERGRFNHSGLGGLNYATRNKDMAYGLEMTGFGYGSLTGATNINTLPADFAAGSNVGVSYTNRAYNFLACGNVFPDVALCDILIENALVDNFNVFDLNEQEEIEALGYQRTVEILENLTPEQKKLLHI